MMQILNDKFSVIQFTGEKHFVLEDIEIRKSNINVLVHSMELISCSFRVKYKWAHDV